MRKNVPLLLIVLCLGGLQNINAQTPQVNNTGFENWTDLGGTSEEPTDWNSFKSADGTFSGFGAQQVIRSTVKRPGSSGTYSAVIWARDAGLAMANGNLTTGRIKMGSTSPGSTSNYNRTVVGDALFNEALGAKPDSLVVWVRSKISNSSHQPRIHATIHDSYDLRDPLDGNSTSHVVGEAVLNYTTTGNVWVRKSVPFTYPGPASNPIYILISISTCKDAGVGTDGDSVYIDDLELIYNPPIATAVNASGCDSGSVTVTSDRTGTQTFELCNDIGTMMQTWTGSATSHVFTGVANGTYRGRVTLGTLISLLSSQTVVTNTPTPTFITQPAAQTICDGLTGAFSLVDDGNATAYQWMVSNGGVWSNIASAGTSPTYSGWDTDALTLSGVVLANDSLFYRCNVSNGSCTILSDSAGLTVDACVGIQENGAAKMFSVGPVPFNDELSLFSETTDKISIVFYTADGKLFMQSELSGSTKYNLDTRFLSNGIYMLRIISDENIETIRIIKGSR